MSSKKIFIGGWYQRTTLHLSETYDFLKGIDSPLKLNKNKLKNLRDSLEIEVIEVKIDEFEHINIKTKTGITVRIFEDGLITLSMTHTETKRNISKLTNFYENKLSPAISYIFSLGAPIPKELANIKTIYPYFIVLNKATNNKVEELLKDFNQEKSLEIKKKKFEIYKGDKLYIINNIAEEPHKIERLINEQIFAREFKGQLHRYLNLHRIIWEKIADIKERKEIRGHEADALKSKIEGYSKTINLIESRLNQMGTYIGTRSKIIEKDKELKNISELLQFRYETLSNTLAYVKEVWTMTKNYVSSAQDLFSDIQAESANSSFKDLTVITSAGVMVGLLRILNQKMPEITTSTISYFVFILLIGYLANRLIKFASMRKKYEIKDAKIKKNIK
ncbi:hypothetical protein ACFL08_02555 [Patescibacteria group bacterium]